MTITNEPTTRVLVCGGRDFYDYELVKTVLSSLQVNRGGFSVVIHGAASGADSLAAQYARKHNIPEIAFPADWVAHGRKAGPLRNYQMLVEGKPDLVVAFPGGKGTADMMRQAKKAGVEVLSVGQ